MRLAVPKNSSIGEVGSGLRAIAFVLCSTALVSAHAQETRTGLTITEPNGYANITVDDMRISSTAGSVRWTRVWDGQEWKFNPQWESLSQSWKNLTGSQTADTTASTVTAPNALASSGGGDDGCWVWVDEDWTPSYGTVLVGGLPEAAPMVPARTTPFNRVMGEDAADYAEPQMVSIDYASLCAGVSFGSGAFRDAEGIRRANELYLGTDGRYAFNNRSTMEKRSVRQLPAASAATQYAALAAGQMALAPITNAKGFRWMDKSGDWIDFNTQGQVVVWGDRNDNIVWLLRDTDGIVRGAVDANGRVIYSLHYTGELITEVRDYAASSTDLPARSVKYQYDNKNRLTQVTDMRGNVTRYDYDVSNRIIKLTDQEGRIDQLAYNNDTVSKRTAPDGAVTDYVFEYDDTNKQFASKITGPETSAGRRVEDMTHNRVAKLVRQIVNGRTDVEIRYDTAARAEIATNARGFVTKITKNEFDQVVRVDYPDGASIKRSYSALHLGLTEETDELGVKSSYEYDTRGNLVKKTEAAGTPDERVTTRILNSLGQVTSVTILGRTEANGVVTADAAWRLEYDTSGQVSKVTDAEGNSRVYVHDRTGNLQVLTDPRGNTARYQVDAAGNLTKVSDAAGRVVTYQYDKVGNWLQIMDARAKIARASYDSMNRRLQAVNEIGGIFRVAYNGQGLPVTETDEDGRVNNAEFDNFLRLTKQTDGGSNTTLYGYNVADGSVNGSLGALFDPTETKYPTFTQQQRYDARERPTSETLLNPTNLGTSGLISSSTYDKRGQITSDTDAAGKTSSYQYNAIGQIVSTTNSLGDKTAALYDVRGNLIQITDPKGNVYKFEFDRNNRVIRETLPLGQISSYSYNEAGGIAEKINFNGSRTSYSYDAANRVSSVRYYTAGNVLVQTSGYAWDASDNPVGWTEADNSRSLVTSAVAIFDDANRKISETFTYPAGNSLSYSYSYSAAGYKTSLTWPDGTVLGYTYNGSGELQSVSIPGEGTVSINEFKWLAPTKVTLPGGAIQERTFDGLLNLESLKVKTPGQQTVLSIANTYGKVQELKQSSRADSVGGLSAVRSSSYSYDDEVRLTQVVTDTGGLLGTDTETFTLDAVGNRIAHSKVSGAWTYDGNNRLIQRGTGANSTTYEYDDAGNLTKKTEPGNRVTNYFYDAQSRIIEIKDGTYGLLARYGYDSFDRRVWKEQYRSKDGSALATAIRSTYLYADEGLIAEAIQSITLNGDDSVTPNGSASIATEYGPRPDAEFTTGMLFVKTQNSSGTKSFAYYHHDQIGTPIQATDSAGNVVWAANYNSFGQATITTPAATQAVPTIYSTLRMPGQVEDSETGLHYNYRRFYDPSIGRYVTQDPIGMEGGDNFYRYAEADPVNLSDPTGECPMCVAYAICVAECVLEDAAINAVTGECNNFGDSAKSCATGCLLGPLSRFGKLFKRAKDVCGGHSFPSDTLVQVRPKGSSPLDAVEAKAILKPISELTLGEEVLALSEWKNSVNHSGQDDRLSYEKIVDIFVSNRQQKVVELTLDDGSVLNATQGHAFKTVNGWRDAISLSPGDGLIIKDTGLQDSNGRVTHVSALRVTEQSVPVFNLEVANAHTFFVGAEGVAVHNGYGSYTCHFKSGKKYHGKGDLDRANKSAKREADRNKDPVKKVDHKPEKNDRDSFKAEHDRIVKDGGVNNPNNYNRINSPGKKY